MRASEIVSRAHRPVAPLPMTASTVPVPQAPIVARPEAQPQQVNVRPPQIPPMAPPPRSGVYQQLMKKHDRMSTRHLT